MTIKTPVSVALAAALTALTIWGVSASSGAPPHPAAHQHAMSGKASPGLANKLARARIATAPYVFDLELAKKQGYRQITPVMTPA